MTKEEIRKIVIEELGNIAPEVAAENIREDGDLREELDIDSISFLNLVIALSKRLGIEIKESDYGRLDTLAHTIDYLSSQATRASTI